MSEGHFTPKPYALLEGDPLTPVRFRVTWLAYPAGSVAGFPATTAARLVSAGIAELHVTPARAPLEPEHDRMMRSKGKRR